MKQITIKKGRHKTFKFPKLILFPKAILFEAVITPSMVYNLQTNKGQINKIIGANHVVRIGFTGENNTIDIYEYLGSKSRKGFKANFIKTAGIGESIRLVYQPKGFYRFISYINFPYFGGKEPAPQDITFNYNYSVWR
ncbi:MAG: hypothetical protein HC836_38475 [Richelia sp. RM2_1_2]|nr:hypothetical protein [Richelia sp. RM2_1_2]